MNMPLMWFKFELMKIRSTGMELTSSPMTKSEETFALRLRKFMVTTTITMNLEDSNEWETK